MLGLLRLAADNGCTSAVCYTKITCYDKGVQRLAIPACNATTAGLRAGLVALILSAAPLAAADRPPVAAPEAEGWLDCLWTTLADGMATAVNAGTGALTGLGAWATALAGAPAGGDRLDAAGAAEGFGILATTGYAGFHALVEAAGYRLARIEAGEGPTAPLVLEFRVRRQPSADERQALRDRLPDGGGPAEAVQRTVITGLLQAAAHPLAAADGPFRLHDVRLTLRPPEVRLGLHPIEAEPPSAPPPAPDPVAAPAMIITATPEPPPMPEPEPVPEPVPAVVAVPIVLPPPAPAPDPVPPVRGQYTIRLGGRLADVAPITGVALDVLRTLNPTLVEGRLPRGTVVDLPVPWPAR